MTEARTEQRWSLDTQDVPEAVRMLPWWQEFRVYVNALEEAKAEAQEQAADYKGRNLAEYYHNKDLQQSLRELGVASIATQAHEQALRQALERLVWHHTEGEGTEDPHDDSVWEPAYAALAATPTQEKA